MNTLLESNFQALQSKLARLRTLKEGRLHDRKSGLNRIFVVKEGSQIRLYFLDPNVNVGDKASMSGIMSRIDIEDPLNLLGVYTQAMMLTLLWAPAPKRIYMLGFGGGRIPMIFYHYFPDVVIESTDLDPSLIEIAEQYFAIQFDERQVLTITDGRTYLQEKPADVKYDMIFVDAFQGTGRIPYELGTQEFYKVCKDHMTEHGILCSNIIDTDPLFKEKVNTFRFMFKETYFFIRQGTYVMFGTDATRLTQSERSKQAEALFSEYKFVFPFVENTKALFHIHESADLQGKIGPIGTPLKDQTPPLDVLQQIPVTDPIFYNAGRNDLCPCGSQLKYKKCHGSPQVRAMQVKRGIL